MRLGGVVCENADQVNINYLHFTVGADRISELMKFGSPKLARKKYLYNLLMSFFLAEWAFRTIYCKTHYAFPIHINLMLF